MLSLSKKYRVTHSFTVFLPKVQYWAYTAISTRSFNCGWSLAFLGLSPDLAQWCPHEGLSRVPNLHCVPHTLLGLSSWYERGCRVLHTISNELIPTHVPTTHIKRQYIPCISPDPALISSPSLIIEVNTFLTLLLVSLLAFVIILSPEHVYSVYKHYII